MKPWLKGGALMLGAYVLFMFMLAPAHLITDRLQTELPLRLSGTSGTLWSGSADEVRYTDIPLGALTWRLSPWSLMFGTANTRLELQGEAINADARVVADESGAVELSDAVISLDAGFLKHAPNIPVDLGGVIRADIARLEADKSGITALDGEITWHSAQVTAPLKLALGDYNVAFETQDKGISGKLRSRGGPLKSSGDVQILNKRRYSVELRLTPAADAPEEVRNLLPLLGRADKKGTVSIRTQGDLMRLFAQ